MSDLSAHFREVLKKALEEKKQRNPRYSMRAFARDLGVNSGYLPKLFAGKTIPSLEIAEEMTKRLGLSKPQRAAFLRSVAEEQTCHSLYQIDPSLTDCDPEAHEINVLPVKKKTTRKRKTRG